MVTSNPLGNLFGRSPIRPIQEHMLLADTAAQLLPDLITAASQQDWEHAKAVQAEIKAAEKAADKMKRSIRSHLPKSLFLPVPRGDLLSLVNIQDHVANTAKDIADLVLWRKMCFPEKLHADLLKYTETCAATSHQALRSIQELDELLEVGFSGREVKRVEEMLRDLDKLERETDKRSFSLRKKLMQLEDQLPPVDTMFYYRAIAALSTVADHAEDVGDRLQILMAK